jgi:hypothetical protein
MFKKILYVGAGSHVDPLEHFYDTKEFIFVDSTPKNEYGYDYYTRYFYRPLFLTELKLNLLKYNFKIYDEIKLTNLYYEINKEYLESTKLYFSDKKGLNLRNERNLTYYISTGFPNTYYEIEKHIKQDLKDVNTVLVSGHNPNSVFVKDIEKPFYFIGYSTTVFPKDYESCFEDDEDSVMSYILKNPKDVKSYVHVKHSGEKTFFNSYDAFYKFHKANINS